MRTFWTWALYFCHTPDNNRQPLGKCFATQCHNSYCDLVSSTLSPLLKANYCTKSFANFFEVPISLIIPSHHEWDCLNRRVGVLSTVSSQKSLKGKKFASFIDLLHFWLKKNYYEWRFGNIKGKCCNLLVDIKILYSFLGYRPNKYLFEFRIAQKWTKYQSCGKVTCFLL